MHIEFLVEDSSGKALLEIIVPKILGPQGRPHSWRLHNYQGVGRIPKGLKPGSDPTARILLDQLPRLLKGYGQTPGIDAVVVVIDSDDRDYAAFLQQLQELANSCRPTFRTLFRLAIEEIEAWYLGDHDALAAAGFRLKPRVLDRYVQDGICGTWELLADAIYSGGATKLKNAGWPVSGQVKHEWAKKIGPHLDIEANRSPSFIKFRDGLRRLTVS